MGFLSRFVSFEKPMAETLTRILYYLAIVGMTWNAMKVFWNYGLMRLDNDWDAALWVMLKTPFALILGILVLRVVAEYVLAHFRIDKSLHDQVTGRAAPK